MLQTIIDIGAGAVVIAGIIGAFWAGFTGAKSTSNSDASETISLINEAKKALEEKLAAQADTIAKQGEIIAKQDDRIKILEDDKAAYVKLFQGDPSKLESYMKETADSMKDLADAMTTVISLVKALQAPATTNVNIGK